MPLSAQVVFPVVMLHVPIDVPAEPLVTFSGRFHELDRCCVNPRPGRRIPIFAGGFSEAAYRRGNLLTKRREMMEAWATYATSLREAKLAESAQSRVLSPLMQGLAGRARRWTPSGLRDSTEQRIQLAGLTETWTPDRVFASKAVFGLCGAGFTVLLMLLTPSLKVKRKAVTTRTRIPPEIPPLHRARRSAMSRLA